MCLRDVCTTAGEVLRDVFPNPSLNSPRKKTESKPVFCREVLRFKSGASAQSSQAAVTEYHSGFSDKHFLLTVLKAVKPQRGARELIRDQVPFCRCSFSYHTAVMKEKE